MKRLMLAVFLATALAGCEDFPLEGGDDLVQAQQPHEDTSHAAEAMQAG